ncbi:MAG: hypothetical protein K2L17_10065 [Muribaculaceae bacterium]|nr:hypothetical protein [Muribaculaceae bacterium]
MKTVLCEKKRSIKWLVNPGIDAADLEDISLVGGRKIKWKDKDGKVFVETSSPPDDGPATVLKINLKEEIYSI